MPANLSQCLHDNLGPLQYSTLLSDTCSKTDQVAGDDAVHTEVLRDLVLYLVQTLVVSAIIHPAENAVILEQLLAA